VSPALRQGGRDLMPRPRQVRGTWGSNQGAAWKQHARCVLRPSFATLRGETVSGAVSCAGKGKRYLTPFPPRRREAGLPQPRRRAEAFAQAGRRAISTESTQPAFDFSAAPRDLVVSEFEFCSGGLRPPALNPRGLRRSESAATAN
jgi:hypothetical protein